MFRKDLNRKHRAKIFLSVLLILFGILGVAHSSYAVWKWIELVPVESGYRVSSNIQSNWYIQAFPTAILLITSICVFITGIRRKMGGFFILLWMFIVALVFFQYDISNNNWQVHTMFPYFDSYNQARQYYYANWPYYRLCGDNERWAMPLGLAYGIVTSSGVLLCMIFWAKCQGELVKRRKASILHPNSKDPDE